MVELEGLDEALAESYREGQCAVCGSPDTYETYEEQRIPYGHPLSVMVVVEGVPIIHCRSCKESYTDHRGEDLRDAAVKLYQQVFRQGFVKQG